MSDKQEIANLVVVGTAEKRNPDGSLTPFSTGTFDTNNPTFTGTLTVNTTGKVTVPYTATGTERYVLSAFANFGREFGLYVEADGNEGGFKANSQFTIRSNGVAFSFISTGVTAFLTSTSTPSVRLVNSSNVGMEITGTGATGLVTLMTNTGGVYAGLVVKSVLASSYVDSSIGFRATGSGSLQLGGGVFGVPNGQIYAQANGVIGLYDSTGANFNRLALGGTTSAFPAIKRSGTALAVRLADDSADAPLTCGPITAVSLSVTGTSTLTGAVGIGAAPGSNAKINIGGTHIGGNNAFGVYMGGLTLQPANTFGAYFQYAGGGVIAAGSNTIATAVGVYSAAYSKTGAGTITNAYGILVDSPTVGTNNYAFATTGTAPCLFTGRINGTDITLAGANKEIAISNTNDSAISYFGTYSNLFQFAFNRRPSTGAIYNAAYTASFINVYGDSSIGMIEFCTSNTPNASPPTLFRIGGDGGCLAVGTAGKLGYGTGAGGAVTQITSRTNGVTLSKSSGDITLVSAAGSATKTTFVVTNTLIAATDTPIVTQKSGTDKYTIDVTNVVAGAFSITFYTDGTTTEQPVFHFNNIKGVNA